MTDFEQAAPTADGIAIRTAADQLRALTQRSHQTTWHSSPKALPLAAVLAADTWRQWPIAVPNVKGHIAWARGECPLWLCQQITVPESLNGLPLAGLSMQLGLTWWAEAVAVYVDGELVQEGDLFDYFARITLSDRVTPGDTFTIAIDLRSPGHDDGALVRSVVMYESTDPALPEPSFVADELTVLQTLAAKLAPEKLATIAAAIAPLDWSKVSQQTAFLQELAALRHRLEPLSDWIKQRQITCTGHAHLDLAWLWPVADTWRAAERTFQSVLGLQQDFPELTYTHSSPALFDWLETHQPELFRAVVAAVKAGSWSIDAGLWVEPELNTLGGESLARQILYGQRYTRSRFGAVSAIAWLPDSFGFSWQLPQLLKLGGVEYFATQKLRWNEATTFPHGLFWWQGLDGTRICSLTLPPIGSDVDAVQMATHSAAWEAQTGQTEMLWLPGMGDHGGGPTRDMLERSRRWAASPFFPRLGFDSPLAHLQRLRAGIEPADQSGNGANAGGEAPATSNCVGDQEDIPPVPRPYGNDDGLPVWNDELYLELHRGCYTVHADQKWYNRRCEDALREAELYGAIAQMLGTFPYPHATLETAWKQVLFNQFHDILPGTAIPEVFETANVDWQAAYDAAKTLRRQALEAIAPHLPTSPPPHPDALPVYLFNSLNWEHTALIEIAFADLPTEFSQWRVVDPATGQEIPTQVSQDCDRADIAPGQLPTPPTESSYLVFQATVPSVGWRLYWLIPEPPENSKFKIQNSKFCLENEWLRAEVDPATGELRSLVEKGTQQNVVRSPANQLQAFEDAGQYWDAWDIAPNYQDCPLPAATVVVLEWVEQGPLRQRLRVVRWIADSSIQQDYVLDQGQPYLQVATVADWQACQVVLKAAFPVDFEADEATYEIPFGAIARPTHPTAPHERAKWEVPAYRWADLSDGQRGLSVLTDYKHGFDAQPGQLRLTLLKAPLWPDPQADRGRHQFTYGLYPHGGDWRTGQTPKRAIAFNTPLQVVIGDREPPSDEPDQPPLPSQGSFLDLGTDQVHLAALKQAEDQPEQYILRLGDLYGEGATVALAGPNVERTDLLEGAIAVDQLDQLRPWEIATFKTPAFINKSLRNLPSPPSPQ